MIAGFAGFGLTFSPRAYIFVALTPCNYCEEAKMQVTTLERSGTIASGRTWRLKPSKTSATVLKPEFGEPVEYGHHLCLVVDDNTDVAELSEQELAELDALPRQLITKLRQELGGWVGRVETNHGLGTQSHYHAHIELLPRDLKLPPDYKVRRCVDSIFVKR